ncbi:hypothetical protein MLD38_037013 [Melastoma candidum]|uniref:Uncharacterized protein n=1 Tax=Melastoma candidum TaxID=119954 RepID=A0ACB9LLV6_9MYRT|nr:hypothetical protein MLD38_037013 [Melastoma candidum]
MDYAFIAAAMQKRWNTWNIQGFMILSLCMQVLLTIFARQRQRTSNRFVIFAVWSAYFLSDWAATFAFGLISNAGCQNSNEAQVPPDVLAFWAAFLLVHLGGPDNITAFSMEDNALWMRHLICLVAQISVFMYIFVKTLPNNRLLVSTILVFVTGVINYGERSRALYLASLENLKKTIKKDTGEEQSDDVHIRHTILKGLVVDIVPDLQECNKSRRYIIDSRSLSILHLISIEGLM